jgi:anti-sigma factor RsiW
MDRTKLREDLVAYVDGELAAADARAVETWLAADAEAQQLRRQLQEDSLALRGLLSAVLREPPPKHLVDAITPKAGTEARPTESAAVSPFPTRARPRPAGLWLAAASIAGLVVGGLAGFFWAQQQGRLEMAMLEQQLAQSQQRGQQEIAQLQQQLAHVQQQGQQDMAQLQQQLAEVRQQYQQEVTQLAVQLDQAQQHLATAQQPQPWIMQVAQYHRVYAGEKRHLVEVAAAETPHIESWLGKRLEMPLVVPDLTAQGLTFQGARMLVINGAPVAQLIYTPPDGRALALCIIRSPKEDKPLTASQQDDLHLVDWRTKGYGFVVVGWEDEAQMRAIAEASQKSFAL